MSRLLGVGLIVSGVLIGSVAVPLSASVPAGKDAEMPSVRAATLVVKQDEPEAQIVAGPGLKPLAGAVALAPTIPHNAPASAAPAEIRPPAAPAARKPIVPAFETVTVPEDPAAITRAVQSDLARVGCYAGPVTGVWGPETRRAMKAFTNRVNATLPVDKPDIILLSLLKAQPGLVCGKACPAGQEGAADGKCVPKSVLAQAARKAGQIPVKPAEASQPKPAPEVKTVVAAAPPPGPVAGTASIPVALAPAPDDAPRMALAGPKPEDVSAAAAAPAAAAKVAKKRERRPPSEQNVKFGQTRWAIEFRRNNFQTF